MLFKANSTTKCIEVNYEDFKLNTASLPSVYKIKNVV